MAGAKECAEELKNNGIPICPLHPNIDKKIDEGFALLQGRLDEISKEQIEFTVKKTLENGYRDKLIEDIVEKLNKKEDEEKQELKDEIKDDKKIKRDWSLKKKLVVIVAGLSLIGNLIFAVIVLLTPL